MFALSSNGRHFLDEHGRPKLWLADTAWNGMLRADEDQWRRYLDRRAAQGFTTIQFVTTQWRGCAEPEIGQPLNIKGHQAAINTEVFDRIDVRLAAIVERGLTPAPVMFWALQESDPGQRLDETTLTSVGREMVDRWTRFDPVYFLAGDMQHEAALAEKMARVGRAVFADHPRAIATVHPSGLAWFEQLVDEPWMKMVGIQSGHGLNESALSFLLEGQWAHRWPEIHKPLINLEPNYEGAAAYGTGQTISPYHVRRAAYWSMLRVPTAGVTYGNNDIWIWPPRGPQQADGHPEPWRSEGWEHGLERPGIAQMTVMRQVFERLPWQHLTPDPALVDGQPGKSDWNRYVAAASTPVGNAAVIYLPIGEPVDLSLHPPLRKLPAKWVDPRTGAEHEAHIGDGRAVAPPSEEDWLLVVAS